MSFEKHYIFGASGFAKEVFLILLRTGVNRENIFFVDSNPVKHQNIHGSEVISEDQFMRISDSDYSGNKKLVYIGIGNPKIRKNVFLKLQNVKNVVFPNLIDPNSIVDEKLNSIGVGNIFCSNCVITIDTKIGNFNHFNLSCTIGHDTEVGDFCTFSPGCNISGNVVINDKVFFGTNSTTIEGVCIYEEAVIGASAAVVSDLKQSGTYVGIPAKMIRKV